jgi:hypothetical protein
VRNIAAQGLHQLVAVIGENLRVPLSPRDGHISHTVIQQVFGSKFSVRMNQYTFCCLSLARMAGDSVTVVDVREAMHPDFNIASAIKYSWRANVMAT